MPKISFSKNRESIDVENGANLMQALLAHNIPVASSCNGKLVCGKCHIKVVSNSYNLSRATQDERDFKEIKSIENNERMACVTCVEGDVCLDTPYW